MTSSPTSASRVHRVTKSELERDYAGLNWSDPNGVLAITPNKKRAMLEHPLLTSPSDPVQLIGLVGDRVIGRLDLFPGEVHIRGVRYRVFWGSNLNVLEPFRSTMMGVTLLMMLGSISEVGAGCGIAQIAIPIYRMLEWTDLEMSRFILLRRSNSVARKYLGNGVLGRIAAACANLGLLAHRALLRISIAFEGRRLRVERLDRMDQSFDAKLAAPADKAAFHRSSAWINWLLRYGEGRNPKDLDRRGLFAVRAGDGEIVGYFVIRQRFLPIATHRGFPDLLLGSVADWMTFDEGKLPEGTLLLLATRELSRWNVDAVEVCTNVHTQAAALRRRGFLPGGALHLMFKAPANSPLRGEEFKSVAAWRIRPAEGDNGLD
jgi:hypothetical protein